MKIQELLSDESKWIKGNDARTKDGFSTSSASEKAIKWCLFGAANKCYQEHVYPILGKIDATIERLGYGDISHITFNDLEKTTFEDIRKVIELANV